MKSIYEYKDREYGYVPLVIDKQWMVARLKFQQEQNLYNIKFLERHLVTDETFILLEGKAVLITSLDINKGVYNYTLMENGAVYNIPKKVWHNIVLSEDADVIIVENANTHIEKEKSEYVDLNNEELELIVNKVEEIF